MQPGKTEIAEDDRCRPGGTSSEPTAQRHTVNVNGVARQVVIEGDTPLLWVLREEWNLPGAKYGCGIARCGACTVLRGKRAIRSCVISIAEVDDCDVTTIEARGPDRFETLERVRQAWLDENVVQCGYCQSGQIMAAVALLNARPTPSDDDIDRAMAGNLCRCGTYPRIRAAIHLAARRGGP